MTTPGSVSGTDKVLYEAHDAVARITMNDPEKRNAFDTEMLAGLAAAFDHVGSDDDVRVVVLTGAGEAFCAGGDVKEMGAERDPTRRKTALTRGVHLVPQAISRLDRPVIAMMNGAAVGAGLDMALMCDLRIASETARFSEGYINVGLAAGDGGAYLLPRLVGLPRALELLFTGRVVTGREAADIGLVNTAVPAAELADATYRLARELAAKPPFALGMMKRLVYQSLDATFDTAMELASSQVAILQCGDEHRNAVASFRSQRAETLARQRGGSTTADRTGRALGAEGTSGMRLAGSIVSRDDVRHQSSSSP